MNNSVNQDPCFILTQMRYAITVFAISNEKEFLTSHAKDEIREFKNGLAKRIDDLALKFYLQKNAFYSNKFTDHFQTLRSKIDNTGNRLEFLKNLKDLMHFFNLHFEKLNLSDQLKTETSALEKDINVRVNSLTNILSLNQLLNNTLTNISAISNYQTSNQPLSSFQINNNNTSNIQTQIQNNTLNEVLQNNFLINENNINNTTTSSSTNNNNNNNINNNHIGANSNKRILDSSNISQDINQDPSLQNEEGLDLDSNDASSLSSDSDESEKAEQFSNKRACTNNSPQNTQNANPNPPVAPILNAALGSVLKKNQNNIRKT